MKKLFISQPMRGKSDEEILSVRQEAIRKAAELLAEEVEVIDTFYTDFKEGAKPLEYIGRSISDMAKADIVYFANGWQDMRGCKIERMCAVEYGLNILEDE